MLEIRCPACLDLGYPTARHIFMVLGDMVAPASAVLIQFHCKRCKSDVQWSYGSDQFQIVKTGERNHHQQKASFE